jgi:WD40 repeat protein
LKSKMLYKIVTLLLAAFSICSIVSCTEAKPTAALLPTAIKVLPTAASTPTLELLPTVIPDGDSLQLWSQDDARVTIKSRFGIGAAHSIDISPDGTLVAVGSVTGVYLYEFDTPKQVKRIPYEQPVKVVEWSPDGNALAVASGAEVYILDAATGAQSFALIGHQEVIGSMAWSPDGRKLASWAEDQHMIVWDLVTGQPIYDEKVSEYFLHVPLHWTSKSMVTVGPLGGKTTMVDVQTGATTSHQMDSDLYSYVTNVSWASDDTRLLTGGELGKVFAWDLLSDQKLLTYIDDWVNASADSVAWSPDQKYVAAGFRDGTILVWDAASGAQVNKLKRKLTGSTDGVVDLEWSPDSRYLISLSRFDPITVWDASTGKEMRSSGEHTSWALSAAWSPDGSRLATTSEDGVIVIRDARTGEIVQSIVDPAGWVTSLAWSPDGKQLASGTMRATIWDVTSGEQVHLLLGHSHSVQGSWSPDGTMFASGDSEGNLFVWDAGTGQKLQSLVDPAGGDIYGVDEIAWSPKGDLLGASYLLFPDPTDFSNAVAQVGFWNPKTGEQVQVRLGLEYLAWHPSENIAASEKGRVNVVVWSLDTGENKCRLDEDVYASQLAWSPDGKLLASVNKEDAIVIFDAQTCKSLHVLNGHADPIHDLTWSPVGDLIASASEDGTVILWGVNPP